MSSDLRLSPRPGCRSSYHSTASSNSVLAAGCSRQGSIVTLAPLREHRANHPLRLFSVNELNLAGQNLIRAKIDLFIPRCIDLSLLSVTDLLERKRGNLALISRETSAVRDVLGKIRCHGASLRLNADCVALRSTA